MVIIWHIPRRMDKSELVLYAADKLHSWQDLLRALHAINRGPNCLDVCRSQRKIRLIVIGLDHKSRIPRQE